MRELDQLTIKVLETSSIFRYFRFDTVNTFFFDDSSSYLISKIHVRVHEKRARSKSY